ncbi:hypothetical protein [Thalassospira lucentensis]|uniref:hypothetical protein n=1 Tax=Thalassospira lucentensis TaxID=168935 RepID=UPI003AA9D0BF
MSEIVCPHCHVVSNNGVNVCVGCQAEVIYGSTGEERKNAIILGVILACGISSFAMVKLFEYNFVAMLVFAGIGAVVAVILTEKAYSGKVRFFRRYFNR